MRKLSSLGRECGIYNITPEDAQGLLGNEGAKNRPVRVHAVHRYARRMVGGLWRLTGEPIILNPAGKLLDGQHRLLACIDSGKPFETVVLYGEFQFGAMGQGASRDGGDSLQLALPSLTHRSGMSAASSLCIRHERALAKEASMYTNAAKSKDNWTDIDNAERTAWVKRNPRLQELYVKGASLKGTGASLIPVSPFVAAWYLAERASDPEEAEAFCSGLMTGAALSPGDPRLLLRQAAQKRLQAGGPAIGGVIALHWIAKAWRDRDKRIGRVFMVKNSEAFPFFRSEK